MANSIRIERLQELIKQKVSHVVQFELSDPRIGIITITRVKLSKDMSHCTISYSVLGDDGQKSRSAHALEHCRYFIQRAVAGAMHTRVTPEIAFAFDPSIEGAARIAAKLRELLPNEDRINPPLGIVPPEIADDGKEPDAERD